MDKKVFLRRVTAADAGLLFEWANDETVRKNSFYSDKITLEEHSAWFKQKLNSSDTLFYILMCDGTPAGQIRLEISEDNAQINYSIAKGFRGQGLGKTIVYLAEERLKSERPYIKKLIAEVKAENDLSRNIFLRSGYQKAVVVYEKAINE